MEKPIVFFDGVCNYCNYWVRFLIKRDKKKNLLFAPLQGETAARMLPSLGIRPTELTSVVLVANGKAYTQSSAGLRLCKYITGMWKLGYGLLIVPKFIRDFFYNIIARNRYKWYGKKEECMVPGPEVRERFLP